ncbi:unnamed protein product [Clonostachys byssicola]|uniref:Uncharacterized protein n=1 Tax=Clonostachys byssicola TaxID=160290 RepID=A0A9N9U6C2_9HYPO|nr:unnamed protein product [Clonostachys byssicola]
MRFTLATLLACFVYMTTCVSAIAISYRVSWKEGKKEGAESSSEEIETSRKDSVINGMSTWSGGKYKATLGGIGARAVIQVQAVQSGSSRKKTEAQTMMQEMRRLVQQNAKSRSPSPEPAKKPKKRSTQLRNKKRSPQFRNKKRSFAKRGYIDILRHVEVIRV